MIPIVEFGGRISRRLLAALAISAFLSSCATVTESITDQSLKDYFHEADAPAATPIKEDLATLRFSEYWTGIVFNGEKIGFSRLRIAPVIDEPGHYDIESEASFVLRFFGYEKKVNLKARDTVNADLSIVRFSYHYLLDDSVMTVDGVRDQHELTAEIVTGGQPVQQKIPLEGPVYPASVIALYPVINGLSVGREYQYRVYSGELQTIADVKQRVAAYESSEFFTGNAFKLETRMSNHRVLTWIDARGQPVFELGMDGVMISALEEPEKAKRYVALAALNKQESLVDFSLIRPAKPIARPRSVSRLKVELSNLAKALPSGTMQRCIDAHTGTVCEIKRQQLNDDVTFNAASSSAYLDASITVQSSHSTIRKTAEKIVAGAQTSPERVARIIDWMNVNIEKAPVDVFSALDVLEKGKAECQGNAYLYTALARASGVPTRIVNGLAYSEQFNGFLYHSWAESLLGGQWQAVDPTFGQTAADATHIKVVEGETLAELLPIMDLVGKVKIEVLDVEH